MEPELLLLSNHQKANIKKINMSPALSQKAVLSHQFYVTPNSGWRQETSKSKWISTSKLLSSSIHSHSMHINRSVLSTCTPEGAQIRDKCAHSEIIFYYCHVRQYRYLEVSNWWGWKKYKENKVLENPKLLSSPIYRNFIIQPFLLHRIKCSSEKF